MQLNEYVLIFFGIFVISNDDCWVICMLLSNVKSLFDHVTILQYAIVHRFPNWGTRTPRGTQSGSGGTRGEHLICVFKVKKPITFSNGAINRHEILDSPNSQVALPEILMYTHSQ